MTLKWSRSAAGLGRTTLQSPAWWALASFCQRCPAGADPWTQAGQRLPHRRNKSVSRHWDPEGCSAWELSQRSFKPPETADQIPGAQKSMRPTRPKTVHPRGSATLHTSLSRWMTLCLSSPMPGQPKPIERATKCTKQPIRKSRKSRVAPAGRFRRSA